MRESFINLRPQEKLRDSMLNPKDVDHIKFMKAVAEELKKNENVKPHALAGFVKSGVNAERPPAQKDFWFLRSAAILRKAYTRGPIGVSRLRTAFGSRKRMGHKPAHHRLAGGKFIRMMLQQLEKAGYLQKIQKPVYGRALTPAGQKFLDGVAKSCK